MLHQVSPGSPEFEHSVSGATDGGNVGGGSGVVPRIIWQTF